MFVFESVHLLSAMHQASVAAGLAFTLCTCSYHFIKQVNMHYKYFFVFCFVFKITALSCSCILCVVAAYDVYLIYLISCLCAFL